MPNQDAKTNLRTSGAPIRRDDPSADDPFVPGSPARSGGAEPAPLDEGERKAAEMAHQDPTGSSGPSYESNQGNPDCEDHGGSTDPHNTLSHSDSGDE